MAWWKPGSPLGKDAQGIITGVQKVGTKWSINSRRRKEEEKSGFLFFYIQELVAFLKEKNLLVQFLVCLVKLLCSLITLK